MAQKEVEVRDSWDDEEAAGGDTDVTNNLTSAFSKFNVNATEFVPNFSGFSSPKPSSAAPRKFTSI